MQNTLMIDTHLTENITGISLNHNKIIFQKKNGPRMCSFDIATVSVYGMMSIRSD